MVIIPVEDDEVLYRRVPRKEGLYVATPDRKIRVSSAAFSDPGYRPSVDRARMCGNDPRKTQQDVTDAVVSVVTRDVRGIDTVVQNDSNGRPIRAFCVDVEHVPVFDHPVLPDNHAHAEIYLIPEVSNKSVFRKLCERLSKLANERPWEIELSGLT